MLNVVFEKNDFLNLFFKNSHSKSIALGEFCNYKFSMFTYELKKKFSSNFDKFYHVRLDFSIDLLAFFWI